MRDAAAFVSFSSFGRAFAGCRRLGLRVMRDVVR